MSEDGYQVIEGPYFKDIFNQPRALRDTWKFLAVDGPLSQLAAELENGGFKRVVLTGMGSSLHALYPLSLKLNRHGHTALMIETSELVHYLESLISPESLIVAVSQSGLSAEIVTLIEKDRAGAKILAITNTERSPLASHATAVLLTHAGAEFSVSAKTYVTALMALEFAGAALVGRNADGTAAATMSAAANMKDELAQAAPLAEEYLRDWRAKVHALAGMLEGSRHLFLVGRGRSLAAARTGALITKESTKFHAEGMSSAAFRHGPMEMLSEETFVAIFEGDTPTRDLNQRLLADIRAKGGRAEMIGESGQHSALRLPRAPWQVRPILEILPVQMMTLALNACAGTEAGRFDFASKITTVE